MESPDRDPGGLRPQLQLQLHTHTQTHTHTHTHTAVIHLCLVHKEPTLLLRNSRSILLEPILRRLESAVVLLRLFARAECSHWFDPWIFSYRKEVTPVHLSLFTRWVVAYWATEFGAVHVADWDESNSFCNLCRTDSPALLANYPNLNCGDCGSNDFIHPSTCTSRHLSEPYRMLQGAAQGDSMGFGAYMLLRILRAKALRTTVSGPPHPCLTSEEGPEVVFADDSRQFGRSAAELGTIVNAAATLANESGASVHPDKLRAYCINLSAGKLVYRADTVYTNIGPLVTHHSGLRVVGIPCVMGDDVSSLLAVSQRAAQNVLRSVCRYRPSYILALRIMLAYVVSSLEYKLAIVPVTVAELTPLQRLLNQTCRSAMGLPTWFPSSFLALPLQYGGLGVPNLHLRLLHRRMQTCVQASSCRSIYTRELVKGLISNPI